MANHNLSQGGNPFYTTILIPEEYFCDREKEAAKISSYLLNGNNIVLKAQRRIGKSSLILHILNSKETKKQFNTLYVDIYQTKNEIDFIREFSDAFVNAPFAKTEKAKKQISEHIPNVKFSAKLNLGIFNAGLETQVNATYKATLEGIFKFLENTDKPNIVVFDEFQTIEDYPEKMAAILRTYIQKMNNTRFIFSGSEDHMLASMFNEANKPFYKSALPVYLDIIPESTYIEFCVKQFKRFERAIDPEAVSFTYQLFTANTFEMQRIMNLAFSFTPIGGRADSETVKRSVRCILVDDDSYYREILALCKTERERNLFQCLAIEGLASELTSAAMIGKYYLGTASAVQSSLKKFSSSNRGQKRIISKIGPNNYRLEDKFFELWLADKTGILEEKYQRAAEIFAKERNAANQLPSMKTEK